MKIKSHTFGGKRYRVRAQSAIRTPDLGECDFDRKHIAIPHDGDTVEELDTIIHEAIHASLPCIAEHEVTVTANDIARLLWRLGWRRDDCDKT